MEDEGRPHRFPYSRRQFTLFSIFSIILLLAISLPLSLAHAQQVDFSMRPFFRGEGLPQGSFDKYNEINVTSLNGFLGYVSLTVSISPVVPNGPVVSLLTPIVSVPSGGSGYSILMVSTVADTPVANYTATITGTSGTLSHSTSVWIAVSVPYQPPDFKIQADPSVVTAQLVPHVAVDFNSSLALTSLNGFSGSVSLSLWSDPGPAVLISPPTIQLQPGATAKTTLTIQPYRAGNYSVLVTGTPSGYLPSHSITVTFNIQPPASDVAILDYVLTYNSKPTPGGTLILTNEFTNLGAALVSVTGLSFNVGFGSFSPSSGLPLNLTSGESKTMTVSIQIPLSAKLGNQSLVATVEWSYYAPGQGFWFQGSTKYTSGSISVSQSSALGPSEQLHRLAGLITSVGPWLLIPYAAATAFGLLLVVRQNQKNRKSSGFS